MTLGQRIRECRRERGMTLFGLGEACGRSATYLSDLERDRTCPSVKTLRRIADALELTTTDLMAGTEALGELSADGLPPGLQELAEDPQWAAQLGPEWLRTLSRIDYCGKRPGTAQDWLELYLTLRRILK